MAVIETLTIGLGIPLAKATVKLWLKEAPLLEAGSDGVLDLLKKKIDDFETRRATQRLFENLQDEVARRLERTIELEFGQLGDGDKEAAILAVATVFDRLDLTTEVMFADLDAARLEKTAAPMATELFRSLGGDVAELAGLILRESCAYVVGVAAKLPNFQVAATRELLRRTGNLLEDLSKVLDAVASLRSETSETKSRDVATFETRYRRSLSQRLDRLQLFGLRLVGAGAREYGLSVAYITLTSSSSGNLTSGDIDNCLKGRTRVVIEGEAGSGKTTLMQWLAVRCAMQDFDGPLLAWNERIPIYLRLRDYVSSPLPTPERMLDCAAPNLSNIQPIGWANNVLSQGGLVIIDGLDELPSTRRPQLYEWLRNLCVDFPNSIFILSSRPAALRADRGTGTVATRLALLGFAMLTLEPMSLPDSEMLVSNWHLAVGRDMVIEGGQRKLEKYTHDLQRVLRERPAIRSLASNPLLCAMICALNWDRQQRLPDDRMELYRLALELLIETRDSERNVVAPESPALTFRAREELLDGLAYWMLRNGYSEASNEDVNTHLASILPRLGRAPEDAPDVLQELLERSGVLRQPQHETVDFIHRTFLEYMAARAAVNSSDFGLLVDKAKEESWRETIVFAVGHAKGATRDKLVTSLMGSPDGGGLSTAEEDVTVACCLETANTNLAPDLLARLHQRAKLMFPPTDFAQARLLAPAAAISPSLLANRVVEPPSTVAAVVRCAATVGGALMLDVLQEYVSQSGLDVVTELLNAWPSFDEAEYKQKIIVEMPFVMAFLNSERPRDEVLSMIYLHLLRGDYANSIQAFATAIKDFVDTGAIVVGSPFLDKEEEAASIQARLAIAYSSRRRGLVTRENAKRLSSLLSLQRITIGKSEPGVLVDLLALQHVEHIAVQINEFGDVQTLSLFDKLESVAISGLSISYADQRRTPLDLRGLQTCARLSSLDVVHFPHTESPAILPKRPLLRRFGIVYSPLPTFKDEPALAQLASISVQVNSFRDNEISLSVFDSLTSATVYCEQDFSLTLPEGITSLHLLSANKRARILNWTGLQMLSHIAMTNTKVVGPKTLVELPALKSLNLIDNAALPTEIVSALEKKGVTVSHQSTLPN